jgi:putative redox protein
MPSNLRHATVTWNNGLVFEGGAPGGPAFRMDGDGALGPSPVVTLLLSAASCSGSDVLLILEKMRAKVSAFRIEITGTRRTEDPKRLTALHLTYHLAGTDLDQTKVRRAIDLSLEKYCSVVHSLAPDIALTYDFELD